ncbi:MAG: PEGA domain-containing protein [Candidatus Dojkabacteria bacterium]
MNKDSSKKIKILSILSTLIVYTGAVLIYLYANGWRIDPLNQQVLKTGVLTVESDPFLANLTIEDKSKGRTPKSASLNVGVYNISVKKDRYFEWRKSVSIKEEKSTTVYPWLIKENIVSSNIASLEGKRYVNSWINEEENRILILTSTHNEEDTLFTYELWIYNTDTTFWDLSTNPKVIFTTSLPEENTFSLLPSPNGQYVLLKNETSATTYILDTTRIVSAEQAKVIDISPFSGYEISWSKDSKHLIFESNLDLISFNVERLSRSLLLKKEKGKKYVWSTDKQGYFYLIQTAKENETERVYAYVLIQEEMDGSNPKVLIQDLFFQKNKEYITKYIEEDSPNKYMEFANSTASTRSVGAIVDITVSQEGQGVFILTDTASYWYNIKTKRYHLISPYSSKLVKFSSDNTKLIYKNDIGYGVFTFLNPDNDPNVEIGSKKIENVNNTDSINWLSNSLYIYYTEENSLYISDQEGENKTKVLDEIEKYRYFGVSPSREYIYTVSVGSTDLLEPISIDKHVIH